MKNKKKIFLSPGHGGTDPGAVGQHGTTETKVARQISYHAAKALRKAGYKVKRFNTKVSNNKKIPLSDRWQAANKWKADAHVPIHMNAGSKSAEGTEVLVRQTSNKAQRLVDTICKKAGTSNRGVKVRTDLGEINNTIMPCYYIEADFISNPSVEKKANKLKWRKKMGKAIAAGLADII